MDAWPAGVLIMRLAIVFGGGSGFITVALGAWAAHGLAGLLDPQALSWIETGLTYQGLHAVGLVGIGCLMAVRPAPALTCAAIGFAAGTLLFCGSLYALAATGVRILTYLTPFGGLAFLFGWACLCWYGVKQRPDTKA